MSSKSNPARGAQTIRVLVVDDQALIRESFRHLLASEDGLDVVGVASDGEQAVRAAAALQPDVVLMDIRMPGMDGVAATAMIVGARRDPSRCRVLALTMFDLDEHLDSVLQAGASGFLLKDSPPTELIAGIHSVARGDGVLSSRAAGRLIDDFSREHRRPRPQPSHVHVALTPREKSVLELIGRGLSNVEIARQLSVSVSTVKTHVSHLLEKLHARDRVQLAIAALRGKPPAP